MTWLLIGAECLAAPFVAAAVVASFALSPRRGALSGLWRDLPERFGALSVAARAALAEREVWWIHAASAGEVAGLAPIIAVLQSRARPPAILVTTTTTAGRDAARNVSGVAWVQLAPIDAYPLVQRFLTAVKPRRLILTETELWPTTILLAARAGLRPVLINGRLTERSMGRYRPWKSALRPVLTALEAVGAQTATEASRFESLGARACAITVTGNSKYDRIQHAPATAVVESRLRDLGWNGANIFVAGSTHAADEVEVIAAFLQARLVAPELKLVLAPRHVERAAEARLTLDAAGLKTRNWSTLESPPETHGEVDALLIDELGYLTALYTLARGAFVGGTIARVGGHNLLEPALCGVPVAFGPHVGHVELPASLLVDNGGFVVHDAGELAVVLKSWCRSKELAAAAGAQARSAALSLRGSAARCADLIESTGA